MKKAVSVVFVLLMTLIVFASIDSKIIPLSSDLYENMDIIYALAGKGTPSNSRPWSVSEAEIILSRVDKNSLGSIGQVLYDRTAAVINEETRWNLGSAGFGAEFEVNPEFYIHTDDVNFVSEDDWIYTFEDRKHFLMLNLDMNIGEHLYSYSNLMYGFGRWLADDTGIIKAKNIDWPDYADKTHIGTVNVEDSMYVGVSSDLFTGKFTFNLPVQTKNFDFIWPRRALVSVGGKSWNISLSRDNISWGNSHIGNFVIDNHESYNEFFKASFFSDRFKYDYVVIFFDTATNNGEVEDTFSKMLLAHRLEFRPMDRLTFSVSEDVMYQTAQPLLKNLNPALIFHNLNNRSMFNAIAYADLDFFVGKGVNVYAQFVLDQATAPNEADVQKPAWGLSAGIEFTEEFEHFVYESSFEGAFTTPHMYRRDKVDFTYFTRTFVYGPSYALKFDYSGFPYGGDAVVFDFNQSALFEKYGKISLDLRLILHGEMGIFQSHNENKDNDGYPNRDIKLLSGELTKTFYTSFNYQVNLNQAIEKLNYPSVLFFIETDFVNVVRKNSFAFDFQMSSGFSVSI